jgi:hypothetical protein
MLDAGNFRRSRAKEQGMSLYPRSVSLVFFVALGCSAMPENSTARTTQGRAIDETSAERSLAASLPAARPFSCTASESPMFDGREPLVMRISGDFTKLNSAPTKEESGSPAQVRLPGGSAPLEATIVARGESRFRNCGFRPFSLKFPKKQSGNVFERLGKTVKFVTHCGDREGMAPIFKADSIEAYEQRLLMEHTTYQVLDQLNVPSLKTRLVRLTYQDTQSEREETYLAFVREPEDEMAERCGMIEAEDRPTSIPGSFPLNAHSELLTHLLNAFVIQSDWSSARNTLVLNDLARGETFWAPYDFDFVGIFRADYPRNGNRSLEQNAARFADWLRLEQSPTLFGEVHALLAESESMRSALAQPGLSDGNLQLFSRWLSTYSSALQEFQSCEGHAQDPSRPSCYVPDEHGALPETATPTGFGEWTTLLEPPGDVDMFSFPGLAGVLYSFGGAALVELSNERGEILGSNEGVVQTSVRLPSTGTVYLRASQGGNQLLASSLGDSLQVREKVLYVYADDHGASLETATRVLPGNVVPGTWEQSGNVMDEDWFRIQVDAPASIRVTLDQENASGLVMVIALGAPQGPSVDASILAGVNELPDLIPAPGEYLVKVMQDWNQPVTTYTVEFQ